MHEKLRDVELTVEQIDDIFILFHDLGIDILEGDETSRAEAEGKGDEEESQNERDLPPSPEQAVLPNSIVNQRVLSPPSRPHHQEDVHLQENGNLREGKVRGNEGSIEPRDLRGQSHSRTPIHRVLQDVGYSAHHCP